MEDLLALDVTYMMLPLDETTFNINANTRAISAPKIVILQEDQIAETVVFTIDRYFDYMDLNNAQIWVQWEAPGENGGVRSGATEIEMRDIASIPGKIRLGWPLENEVTKVPGTVKYSVRFWNKGYVTEEGQTVEKVVYSFNTLTSSLTITPSLQPTIDDSIDLVAPVKDNIFKRAIRNSLVTGEGIAIPADPRFAEPGKDLDSTASLDIETNTLTLKAQAVISDTGHIEYEWYYKPAVTMEEGFDSNTYYPYNSITVENSDGTTTVVPGFSSLGGQVKDKYEAVEGLTELIQGEQYYVEASDTSSGYKAYTGTTIPESGILYERYTTYTVPTGDVKVTGDYEVRATNYINPNVSHTIPSTTCRLISPDDVVFTTNLPERLVIEEASADLAVKLVKQTSDYANVSYTWAKGTDSEIVDETIEDADNTSNSYTVASPGYYQVTAAAILNRETKTAQSGKCVVTFMPAIPETSYGEISASKFNDRWNGPMYDDEIATLDLVVASVVPSAYAGYDPKLFSESMTYTWIVIVDEDPTTRRVLTTDDVGVLIESGLGTPTLVVKNPEGLHKYTFKCLITNNLNGKTVTQDESNALVFHVM